MITAENKIAIELQKQMCFLYNKLKQLQVLYLHFRFVC